MLASLACAPRRLACRYWAGRVALRENRARQHHSAGPRGSEAASGGSIKIGGKCGRIAKICFPEPTRVEEPQMEIGPNGTSLSTANAKNAGNISARQAVGVAHSMPWAFEHEDIANAQEEAAQV